VTLQPLARFELDAAILFSDILTVPDAMGLGLYFAEGEGPKFERPLREEWAIRDLTAPDPNVHLRYVMDAVAEIRRALHGSVPLIGFSGSPWTLACYMVEGGSGAATDYRTVKTMLYDRPDLLHRILDVTTTAVIDYLNAQIASGAQAVMIFDSWGGVMSHAAYREFSLAYMQRIVAGLTRSATASACPASCSPRAAGSGWKPSPTSAAMRWAWTGPAIWAKRGGGSAIALRCRATSIRWRCLPRRTRWPPRPSGCSTVMRPTLPKPEKRAATSSISATAFPSSPRRTT
jgi:uroporphyrinogen decarboxylase